MRIISLHKKWHKPFIVLLIISHLFSCSQWKLIKEPIEVAISKKPELIKVEKTDKERIEVYNPFIDGDSLKGFLHHRIGLTTSFSIDSTSISLGDIRQIYLGHTISTAPISTFLGVVFIVVVVYGIILFIESQLTWTLG